MSLAPDILRLAARNTLRHRGRSGLTLLAIAAGVAALVLAGGFIKDTVVELGESMIRSQSGHLQVSRDAWRPGSGSLAEGARIGNPAALRKQLAAPAGVREVMFRTTFDGLLGNGRVDWAVVAEGIEPAPEARLGTYIELVEGRQLAAADEYAAVLGAGVAQALAVAVGDWVTLTTTTAAGAINLLEFEVVGVFRSFSKDYDARAVRVPLPAAQRLLDSPGVHVAVIHLADTAATDRVAAALRNSLGGGWRVRDWRALNPFYRQTVQLYRQQFGFLVVVILLAVLLSVGNAVNMGVHERAAEFGTLRACGSRGTLVRNLVLAESAMLGLAGALLGVALGNGLALAISAVGIPMPPPPNSDIAYVALVRLSLPVSALAALTGFLAPVLAALGPARRAARRDIADALRQAV
ncbi:ABC transporter permease [Pseudohaliea sp.]|uniref:ABC transporter permease n=1 Tax=Pseudohaliea sp. TaxID=2740289 RepID=UPI0032F0238C